VIDHRRARFGIAVTTIERHGALLVLQGELLLLRNREIGLLVPVLAAGVRITGLSRLNTE
jgi:hypothetical protein